MRLYKDHEPGNWNADWKGRMEWTIKLFKEGMFERCIADCRTMLLYERLLPEYRIYCHTLIAASLDDWDEAEEARIAVDKMWTIYRWSPHWHPCPWHECMSEIREFLDDLAEAMEKDRSTKGNSRHRKRKVSRKKKNASRSSVMASASDAPTNHVIPVAQETAETALPSHPAITLTVRSRGPLEGDGAPVRNDDVLPKRTLQDRLSASASHDHDDCRADDAIMSVDGVHNQEFALGAANGEDVVMSDE